MTRHLVDRKPICAGASALMVIAAAIPEGHAASTLPLREGEYATACSGGVPDILASMGYYIVPPHHEGVLTPEAEGQSGYCHVRDLKAAGRVYSGNSSCDTGTRILSSTGTYRFSYTILNETNFVSRGKTYRWCTPGR